jgi:hypothetical protein
VNRSITLQAKVAKKGCFEKPPKDPGMPQKPSLPKKSYSKPTVFSFLKFQKGIDFQLKRYLNKKLLNENS